MISLFFKRFFHKDPVVKHIISQGMELGYILSRGPFFNFGIKPEKYFYFFWWITLNKSSLISLLTFAESLYNHIWISKFIFKKSICGSLCANPNGQQYHSGLKIEKTLQWKNNLIAIWQNFVWIIFGIFKIFSDFFGF